MFAALRNTPRPYAWGSTTEIAEALGRVPSGGPEAELWLGAHHGSPAELVDPQVAGGAADLAAWIAADPATTLGDERSTRLPFLLKVLAAASPLSLQAHPTPEQARDGFAREEEAGIPVDAPDRSYRDPYSKPELIVALSDTFDALCGFRGLEETRRLLRTLQRRGPSVELEGLLERLAADDALPAVVEWLSVGGPEVDALVASVTVLVSRDDALVASDTAVSMDDGAMRVRHEETGEAEFGTARMLAAVYPGDPGVVVALLLNRVTLRQGEALYLPAGNIHAYLEGLGIELMAASDNVLRGGLTPKHVDVPELLRVLDFAPTPVPYLAPEHPSPAVEVFRPDVPDFVLVHVRAGDPDDPEPSYRPDGPAIALCVSGTVTLAGRSSATLRRGESVYITPDEGAIAVTGTGRLFLATTGVPAAALQ
jgi:mannose-6-phosphate isomerase